MASYAEMTPDRARADMLAAADAAGFERFAYCGHLWGAIRRCGGGWMRLG